jgi:hypothetical protein
MGIHVNGKLKLKIALNSFSLSKVANFTAQLIGNTAADL